MIAELEAKLLGALAIAGALGGVLGYVHHKGYAEADEMWKQREAVTTAAAEKHLAEVTADSLAKERGLAQTVAGLTSKLVESNQDHENIVKDLESRARAGDLRLSIATRRTVSGCTPPPSTAATAGTLPEERTDVMPEVAAAVFDIAGDSAKSVREYNALVDLYNAARAVCNAPVNN